MPNTPTVLHRNLIRDALAIAWKRKALWVFGLFAALVSTGGMIDVAFRTFHQVEAGRDYYFQAMDGALPGLAWVGTYVRLMSVTDTNSAAGILTVISLGVILLAFVAVLSQGALIAGVLKRPGLPRPMHLIRESLPWVPRLAVLAFFGKAAQAVLVMLMTLPLVLYLSADTYVNGLIYFVLFLLFFPLTIIIHLASTLAAFETIRHEVGLGDAVRGAVAILRRHWLSALELGVILFVLLVAAGIITIAGFILLAIPFSILLSATYAAGIPILFSMSLGCAAILGTMFIWVSVGASVSLQYAAWAQFHEHASHPKAKHRVVPKLERLWAKL